MTPFQVLAIDPGRRAGACYDWLDGAIAVEEVTKAEQRRAVVARAVSAATAMDRPLVVVGETWNPQGWAKPSRRRQEEDQAAHGFSARSILGMGASWGWWDQLVQEVPRYQCGRRQFPRVVRVLPEVWRRAPWTIGRARPPRDQAAALELARARQFLESQKARGREVLGELDDAPDVAAAVCIYLWAKKAPTVLEELGR